MYLRNFPREIEADLLFRGIDIHDWHRGEMSSRRLLCLIDALPDDSAYQRERRDGDWSEAQWIIATLVNETKLLRADQVALAGYEMKVNLFESPAQQQETEKLNERVAQMRAHVVETMQKAKQGHLPNGTADK